MPMEQEYGIEPFAVGVNSMMFSPFFRFVRMPSEGTTMLEAQVNEDSDVMTHRTGVPAFTRNVLGEYPDADCVILITWTSPWSAPWSTGV